MRNKVLRRIVLAAIVISATVTSMIPAMPAYATGWYSTGYSYRKSITVSRPSGAVTNYPLKIKVGQSPGTGGTDVCEDHIGKPSFDDLIFTTSNGTTSIPYWIESITGTDPNLVATVWVNFDSIGTTDTTFYMYYGNTTNTNPIDPLATGRWQKDAANPVMAVGASGQWDDFWCQPSSIIKVADTFYMYYIGSKSDEIFKVGLATSPDGVTWTKYTGNPILTVGTSGAWDDETASYASVYNEGSNWYMLYSGDSGTKRQIGLATSTDGYTWTKYGSNPVIPNGAGGSWDSTFMITGANIIKEGSTYYFWYAGNNVIGLSANSGFGLATSTDFITWTKSGSNPVMTSGGGGKWDEGLMSPSVYKFGSTYYMYYEGVYADGGAYNTSQTGLATSTNKTTWTRYSDIPVLANAIGTEWDNKWDELAVLVNAGDEWLMYFGGSKGSPNVPRSQMGVAHYINKGNGSGTFTYFNDWVSKTISGWTVTGSVNVTDQGWVYCGGTGGAGNLYTTATYGDNYAVRSKILTAHYAGGSNSEAQKFYVQASGQGYYQWFDYNGATYPGKEGGFDGGWGTTYTIDGWSANIWHTADIIRKSTTDVLYYVDDANLKTETDKLTASNKNIEYQANSAGATALLYVDWTIIRQYVSTEPAISAYGAEVAVPAPIVVSIAATNLASSSVTLQGSLSSMGGFSTVYVYFEYGLTTSYTTTTTEKTETSTVAFSEDITGLAPSTVYHYRAVVRYDTSQYAYGIDRTFATAAPGTPTVTTGSAIGVTTSAATLQGTITSLGTYPTVYVSFEYGLTAGYGSSTIEQTETTAIAFNQPLSGFSSNTTYHFRARVRYDATNYVNGADATFTTASSSGVPNAPTNLVVSSTTATSTTLTWEKAAGATNTLIRWSLTNYPAAPTEGTSLYNGNGVTTTHAGQTSGLRYYYSAWSETGGVYSTSYATTSVLLNTSSSDLVVSGAAVFTDYYAAGDWLIVADCINTYAGYVDVMDVSRFFNIQLLDPTGTTVIAANTVKNWHEAPESIYISANMAGHLTYGGAYIIKMVGMFTGNPSASYTLTPEDWTRDDLTYLDGWIFQAAYKMNVYYSLTGADSLVAASSDGSRSLTPTGGAYFKMGIPNIGDIRPDIFQITTKNAVTGSTGSVIGGTASNFYDNSGDVWQTRVGSQVSTTATAISNVFGFSSGKVALEFVFYALLGIAILLNFFNNNDSDFLVVLAICVPIIFLANEWKIISMQLTIILVAVYGLLFVYKAWWSRT